MKRKHGKIMTKICAAVTSAGMLLGALPGLPVFAEETEDAAMGRYVEADVALPENFIIEKTVCMADGSLRIFGINQETESYELYDSDDGGESWESAGALQDFSTDENYLTGIALSPEGGGAGVMYDSSGAEDPSDGVWSLITFDEDGTVHQSELSGEMSLMTLAFTGSGELVGQCHNVGVMKIDRSTAIPGDPITSDYGLSFGLCGEEVILLKEEEVQRYSLTDGEPLERDEALEDALYGEGANPSDYMVMSSMGSAVVFTEDGEGRLFYCTRNGIFAHAMGGSVVEQVVDGSLTSLSDPNGVFGALVVLGKSLYVQYTTGDGSTGLYRYTYDETVPSVPQHELTVYSLKENETIQQAAVLFQKAFPDTYVNYVTGMSGEDGVTASDALRTLNTDILAGNGPDVLVLDGMSVQSYSDKGVLADLSGILQEIADTDGLLENVAKTYQDGDVIPAVPAKFSMEMAAGDPGLLKTLDGLESIVALASVQDALDPGIATDIEEVLYPVCAGAWNNKDGTINQEELAKYVAAMKQIDENYRSSVSDSMRQMLDEYDQGIYTSLSDLGVEMNILGSSALTLAAGRAQVVLGSMGGAVSYCELYSVNKQIKECGVELLDGQLSDVFLPSCILGVLNTAKEEDRAMDFVKFILSKESQSEISYDGFSVNRSAFEESLYTAPFEEGMGYSFSSDDIDGNYVEIVCEWPEKESLDKLAAMAEQLSVRADTEQVQRDVVLEETRRCIDGEISVDEAVNSIMQKLNLYLAE